MYKSACLFTLYGFKYLFCGEFCYYSPSGQVARPFLLDKSNEVEQFEDFFKQGIDPECREHPPLSAMRRSPSHCRSVFGIRSAVGGRRSRSAAGFSDRECRAPRPTLSSSLRSEAREGRF